MRKRGGEEEKENGEGGRKEEIEREREKKEIKRKRDKKLSLPSTASNDGVVRSKGSQERKAYQLRSELHSDRHVH